MSYKQKKFLKSLAWNLGGVVIAFTLDSLATNLGIFNLSPEATAVLAVIISRITKVVNVYFQEKKAENERY